MVSIGRSEREDGPEIVALEFDDRGHPLGELAQRVEAVLEACAGLGVETVGLSGLVEGRISPASGDEGPALVVGFRAGSVEAAMRLVDVASWRGYCAVVGAREEAVEVRLSSEERRVLWGMGAVVARGAYWDAQEVGPAVLRQRLADIPAGQGWMPGGQGLVGPQTLKEARRHRIGWVWTRGGGVQRGLGDGEASPAVVEARRDAGDVEVQELAQWVAGDRGARRRFRLHDLRRAPGRWVERLAQRAGVKP